MQLKARFVAVVQVGVVIGFFSGCSVSRPSQVSPNEIPTLEARLVKEPRNGELVLRYAAALFAAGNCDSALTVAQRGVRLRPASAVGPLVIGQCYEQAERYDEAVAVYRTYLRTHHGAPGVNAVRGRETLARRAQAADVARRRLAAEDSLAAIPADPQSVGVLPLLVAGDSTYQPISLGLAELIAADLGLLQRFRMVERLQLQALVSELRLTETDLVQAETAPRLGRLARAGRLIQGTATIPPSGETVLEANIVLHTGEIIGPTSSRGEFPNLLRLEKELVLGIANQLGYQLSTAERQRILENGTQNLVAFLAYASGLAAEETGNYALATQYFSQAVQADPGFSAARERQSAAVGAEVVSGAAPGDVTVVATATEAAGPPPDAGSVGDAMASAIGDVSGTQGEQATTTTGQAAGPTQQAAGSNIGDPQPTVVNVARLIPVTVRIRVP